MGIGVGGGAEAERSADRRLAEAERSADRWLAVGLGVAAVAYVALFLPAAVRGWFSLDDFAFLARVQHAPPSVWLDPRVALETPFWSFYRPLGMEGFYALGHGLFGMESAGFRVLALVVDLLTGLLVFRIGRQVGLAAATAAAAALFSVTCAPRTHVLFEAYSFQYTSALFFTALTVSLFLDHLRGGSFVPLLASVLALLAGLLCNEVSLAAPAACGLLALRHERASAGTGSQGRAQLRALRRSVLRLLPYVVVAAPWLALRFAILEQVPTGPAYETSWGTNLAQGALRYLAYVLGPGPLARGWPPLNLWPLAAAAALWVGSAFWVRRGEEARRRLRQWWWPLNLVLLGWGFAALLPFLPLYARQPRYAAPLSIPLALALGSWLDLCWRAAAPERRRWLALVVGALLLAALPYGTLRDRRANPEGVEPRLLYDRMRAELERTPETLRFYVLYGGSELGSERDRTRFERLVYKGAFERASFPERFRERTLRLRWVDVARGSAFEPARPCVWLELDAGRVDLAGRERVGRVLSPGLAGLCASSDTR